MRTVLAIASAIVNLIGSTANTATHTY